MQIKPCVIGLGYVGLPILLRVSKKYNAIGYDVSRKRVKQLKNLIDSNKEYDKKDLSFLKKTLLTCDEKDLLKSNLYIISVPTPIHKNKKPDLKPLKDACLIVSKYLKKFDIIMIESTVYPGTTMEFCLPLIEKQSGMNLKSGDFFIGYSPERVNPGDNKHTIDKIKKIVSINDHRIKNKIVNFYKSISKEIIFSNSLIECETSKVIENIQRDLNIALMNEIFKYCHYQKINFQNVLNLASTKWNFLPFKPGLVGGHCLPVDPYYFSYKAKKINFEPRVVLAGRNTNEGMKNFYIKILKKEFIKKKINFKKDKIIFLGLTYKKNVADLRNSQAKYIYNYFSKLAKNIYFNDPFYTKNLKINGYINLSKQNLLRSKCLVVLVNHDKYIKITKTYNEKIINLLS